MAITYTWKIPRLEYYPHKNGFDKVVHCIHWILIGTDEDNRSASNFGSQTLPTNDLDPDRFIAYDSLTQEQVEQWLQDAMIPNFIDELKSNIQTQINNIINPPNVTADPPWAV